MRGDAVFTAHPRVVRCVGSVSTLCGSGSGHMTQALPPSFTYDLAEKAWSLPEDWGDACTRAGSLAATSS